jgi:hypothetical protein
MRLSPRRAAGLSGPRLSVQGARVLPSNGRVCRMVEKCGYVLTIGDQQLVFEVGYVARVGATDATVQRLSPPKNTQ